VKEQVDAEEKEAVSNGFCLVSLMERVCKFCLFQLF